MATAMARRSAPPQNRDLQLVCLTARPADLARSLASFGRHMGSRRVVIAAPMAAHAAVRGVMARAGMSGVLLGDEELVSGIGGVADHATRNFVLRRALYAHAAVDPVFVALDDDAILLRPLPDGHFYDGRRAILRYSHADMANWKCSPFETPRSYDRAQWETARRLAASGLPRMGFGAHQPQIIVKADFAEAVAALARDQTVPLDEWSAYGNFALAKWPERYRALKSTTLFWPGRYGSWMPDWFDPDVWFENYYAANYEKGGPAFEAGIDDAADWRIKRDFCAAGYATGRMAHMLNELSCGAPLRLEAADGELRLNATRLLAIPGPVLRIAVAGDRELRARYVMRRAGRPVPECAAPAQRVGPRADLCLRMPREEGEYDVELSLGRANTAVTLHLPLSVLPAPVIGNV
jgi:hypothetical protein